MCQSPLVSSRWTQSQAQPLSFVFLDLEFGRNGRFYAIAVRRDEVERVWENQWFETAHRQLVEFAQPDDVLVGHNIHRFDRLLIQENAPDSPLLALPTLDTLELSVLAFPQRPYHRLTKDDQLVRDSRPKPLSDVRASEQVLRDAIDRLGRLDPDQRSLLVSLVPRLDLKPHEVRGWRHLFGLLGWSWDRSTRLDLASAWSGRVCNNSQALVEPALDMPLLMVAAWLRAANAGDGSVLPAWVRRTWPTTARLVRDLRATRCSDPACAWCATQLSPEHWLHEVFGFEGFRAAPPAPGGGSLQRLLVERALQGEPTFGILPTGGGKSLCFQVPAEARHRLLGQLTVVISPLQSLMKDQVDSLKERIPHARAIYSGLASLLRPQVIDEVRSGRCGLLYLSPEQFRNAGILRMLGSRELGAVVFDEAHCLSQWGHDFRTDYPYVLRAVREMVEGQGAPMPPVFLFTATTQRDATDQIVAHVQGETGRPVEVLDGGSERPNLTYLVRPVPGPQRLDVIEELLEEHLGDGTAIVFCGSRRGTEETADELVDRGHEARAYHAGLDADTRRDLQDAFLAGQHRIITATNAFGMGVDKADVRLVVHLDMPSSLEAWLQEAGRAGRDREPATAVLLWSPGDAEARFSLGALGDLSIEDLQALWRAIRLLPAGRDRGRERCVVTARELLFQEALAGRFDPEDEGEETRVKAGVNWLERADVLQRRENITRVFSGRPQLPSLEAAIEAVAALDLPKKKALRWQRVLQSLYAAGDEGLDADDIAVLCNEMSYEDPLEGGMRVLSILKQMADRRLVSTGQTFSAFVARGIADSSKRRFRRWCEREEKVVDLLEESLAGAADENATSVHLRPLADRLSSAKSACTTGDVSRLLGSWSSASQGQSRGSAAARFQARRGDYGRLHLNVPLQALREWLKLRRDVAGRALSFMVDLGTGSGGQILVSSDLEKVVREVESDLLFRDLPSLPDAVRSAVSWLHDLRIITVQSGLAVFRSAMLLERRSGGRLQGNDADEAKAALHEHRLQKILRVHVMDTWARRMVDDDRADDFRGDWFALPVDDFKAKWFPKRTQQIERPTGPESYDAIVDALNDPVQEKIVTRDIRTNHLVLAGPGSGKTRILVHRVAWLLRCRRVRPRQILVVCYTRANAIELKRRLWDLVGRDSRGVTVRTLHGVALTLVGAHRLGPDGDLTIDTCIPVATRMLQGEELEPTEQSRQRDALLRGFTYLFVDEYQDIDQDKYDLLSALAGRALTGDHRKLRLFAVGDDDQAIFSYAGASTDFIRCFERDYRAARFVVPHNYRNPAAVLEMAQRLIEGLPGRLKAGEALTVDGTRLEDHPAGPWAAGHPQLAGRIVWYSAPTVQDAARSAMQVVHRWIEDDGVEPKSIGILARTHRKGLNRLRIEAERYGIAFRWPLPPEQSVPLGRVREVVALFDHLDAAEETVRAAELADVISDFTESTWKKALRDWLDGYIGERLHRDRWRYELVCWVRLERSARMVGEGIHLGTMHSAKGLEFDHVLLLDDGTMEDTDEERRLLYVAITRARMSLQIFSGSSPSRPFRALDHPLLDIRRSEDSPVQTRVRHYGLVGPDAIWIDWLGRQPATNPGHRAMDDAWYEDAFRLVATDRGGVIVDARGIPVARLSKSGCNTWLPLLEAGLELKLLATTLERADDSSRDGPYREQLKVERWWTGVWEARWRPLSPPARGPGRP